MNSNVQKKISVLSWLFLIQGLIFVLASVSGITGIGSHDPYWRSLIQAIFFVYIFFSIKKANNKVAYNLAVFFSGLAILENIGTFFFVVSAKTPLSLFEGISILIAIVLFGVLPFSILVQKQVKSYYIQQEKLIEPQVKSTSGILFLIWFLFTPVLAIYLSATFEDFWGSLSMSPLILIILLYLVGGILLFYYYKQKGFWNKA